MSEPICVPLCPQCGLRPVEPPRRLCWPCFKGPTQLATVASSTPTPTIPVTPIRTLPALDAEPPGGWTWLTGQGNLVPDKLCQLCGEQRQRRRGLCTQCYDRHDKSARRRQYGGHPLDTIVREVEKALVKLANEPLAVAG